MALSIKKTGLLAVGLTLSALAVSASVQAKTLVYCSEGSLKVLIHSYSLQVQHTMLAQFHYIIGLLSLNWARQRLSLD